MPRFAANISMMYVDLPFLDRFEAAAADGFKAVEFLFPYEWPAQELRARLQANGLQQVLFNTPPGGSDAASIAKAWANGDKGLACVPGREQEFRDAFALALEYAAVLECPRIHTMVGLARQRADRNTLRQTLVDNLRWAARKAKEQAVDVLIEPINTRDIPGFFLNRQDEAHAILAEVDEANAKVQMDLYHCQIVEGDVAEKIRRYLPTGRVGHFQIAGTPGRHEPDIGELNYPYLFGVIDEVAAQGNGATGWGGWVGCEYRPLHGAEAGGTSRGLGWLYAAMAQGLAQR